MKTLNFTISVVNFAFVFVWTFTDRPELALLNGVAAIMGAIWSTHPQDTPGQK